MGILETNSARQSAGVTTLQDHTQQDMVWYFKFLYQELPFNIFVQISSNISDF